MKVKFGFIICILLLTGCSDKQPPRVEMFFPHDGDVVFATVYITAKAIDNESIDRIEFFLDDTLVGRDENIFQDSFYQHIWPTAAGPDSVHVKIYAIAYDVNQNSAVSNTINVFVDNAGNPPRGNK
jgi:hypothetical protein